MQKIILITYCYYLLLLWWHKTTRIYLELATASLLEFLFASALIAMPKVRWWRVTLTLGCIRPQVPRIGRFGDFSGAEAKTKLPPSSCRAQRSTSYNEEHLDRYSWHSVFLTLHQLHRCISFEHSLFRFFNFCFTFTKKYTYSLHKLVKLMTKYFYLFFHRASASSVSPWAFFWVFWRNRWTSHGKS